jgi:hypothetical protein
MEYSVLIMKYEIMRHSCMQHDPPNENLFYTHPFNEARTGATRREEEACVFLLKSWRLPK